MKVSVVISAFNEELKIEDCLKSVKKIASEIIVIDGSSTDKTPDIASKFTKKIYKRPNNLMLNVNKNFGFSKAESQWILSIDADERIEEELADEILNIDEKSEVDGFYIPRKNIIFGRWIKHTGWYPDHQLRLFKKDKGRFGEVHVHEMLEINGQTANLKGHIYHLNYDNVSHFLEKTINVYTVSEAQALIDKGYVYNKGDLFKMPVSEFITRFFAKKGYLDGTHGLVLSFLMGFYHFIVFLRLWEINRYKDDENSLELFREGTKFTRKEVNHWLLQEEIDSQKSFIRKKILKIKNKLKRS